MKTLKKSVIPDLLIFSIKFTPQNARITMGRIFTVLFLLITIHSFGQNKDLLFGPTDEVVPKHGFILNGNGDFDIPAADMAKRFGLSYRLGPAVLYKTKKNWMFGAKCDFILGSKVKQDSLMINIKDMYSSSGGSVYEFINNSGERIGVPVYERGYMIGLSAGKLIPIKKMHPDNGIMLLTTAGFIQHKIDIYVKDKDRPQLRGNYLKGYDRLSNGLFVEQYAGYTFFSEYRLINFTLGFDALFGFTQGRRDYLFDVMHADTQKRLDILYGIRGGWFIPMFHRKSEDILFE